MAKKKSTQPPARIYPFRRTTSSGDPAWKGDPSWTMVTHYEQRNAAEQRKAPRKKPRRPRGKPVLRLIRGGGSRG